MAREYFESMVDLPELPLLDKPCHDCAITTGFYIEIADELLQQDIELQDKVLKRWFCHNHRNKACRGAYNYVHTKRKVKANESA
jgi:hypothetical protein